MGTRNLCLALTSSGVSRTGSKGKSLQGDTLKKKLTGSSNLKSNVISPLLRI